MYERGGATLVLHVKMYATFSPGPFWGQGKNVWRNRGYPPPQHTFSRGGVYRYVFYSNNVVFSPPKKSWKVRAPVLACSRITLVASRLDLKVYEIILHQNVMKKNMSFARQCFPALAAIFLAQPIFGAIIQGGKPYKPPKTPSTL